MFVRDVNNYGGIYEDNTKEEEHIKLKGDYEIDKEFHKDPSMRIVPLAVKEYFVYGTPIEETIRNHNDIFDFCLQLKCNSNSTAKFKHIVDGKIVDDTLHRITRYYIGNGLESGTLYKDFGNNRISGVNVGYSAIIFNKYVKKDIKDYKLNYSFYIKEAYKLKNAITTGQLELDFYG